MTREDASSLFDMLPVGAYRSATDGRLLRVNAALVRMNGYETAADMIADSSNNPHNPYVTPGRRELFMTLLESQGQVRNFESEMVRFRRVDTMRVREHAHAVRDGEGQLLYFEGTVEDITEERQAKERMRKNEAMLLNLLQTIPDQVWLKDVNGVYMTCNDNYAQALGEQRENIIGTRDADWVGTVMAEQFLETDRRAMRAGKPVSFEENHVGRTNPQGELHEVIKTPMYDADGTLIGVLGMGRNIQARKNAEHLLRDTSEQLELAIMSADLGRWSHDLTVDKGYYMDVHACQMLGRPPEESEKGRPWGHLIHPDDLGLTLQAMRQHLSGATPSYEAEFRARHMDGRWVWLSSRGKVVQIQQDGSPMRMVGTLSDISARKQSELQLLAIQAELQATLNALPDLLFEFDATGRYVSAHSHEEMGDESNDDYLIGKTIAEVLPQEATQVCMDAIAEAIAEGRSRGRQYSLQLPTGKHWYELSVVRKPTPTGEEVRVIAIARDVTEAKEAAEAIRHLAFHDSLTGLPNRRMLTDRLQRGLAAAKRHGQSGALMFLDLDRFKELNDTQGHDVGDLLLMEVGRRLVQSVRAIDTVARLGGDEFVVLIEELGTDFEAAHMHAHIVGQKILASLNEPYMLGAVAHTSTPSIGAALFGTDTPSHQDVLKEADIAMYTAKAAGRNMLKFYEPNMAEAPE
ncbi:MAG: diguanylate cyclase [Rhodoferax sp.]|nr:diguanylate cyclase [Rhodoferax sp.]